ncbi:DUF4355 domain-containing protein [Clostridium felsineum]|uniref:capsid assembly scaffolding protein Gp46 family protein n=1 Tax=Clostridium felsineum TaxID=36839 RepID=UPI00214D2C99|nr:DUF4355 domain-containing protein [Clostridium felsineum]MCR3760414.1 DUF4355 domain-containing protein [Clostridium felsineum]
MYKISKGQFLINLKLCSVAPTGVEGQPTIEGNPGGSAATEGEPSKGGAPAAEGTKPVEGQPQGGQEPSQQEKTFKQEDVTKIVTDSIAKEKLKWEKEYNQKLENEKKEAERLAKMTAAEKEKAIFEKQKSDLATKEKEIALKEMKFEAVKILNDRELPIELVDMLATTDADNTKANIDAFDKAFKAALSKAVDARIKASSTAPKAGSTVDLTKSLEVLRAKASQTGKMEDRVAYAKMKQQIEQQKINQ